MPASSPCHICKVGTAERTILVLQSGQHADDWPLCEACWRLLERSIHQIWPDGTVETVLKFDGRLPKPQLPASIAAGLQTDGDSPFTLEVQLEQERRRLLRSRLHAIGAELIALAATRGGDRNDVLKVVREIESRARLLRMGLERELDPAAADTTLPPLAQAIQAVGGVITDREVDRLPPDELRARLHAVLHTLDRALQDFLQFTDKIPFLESPKSDAPQDPSSESA